MLSCNEMLKDTLKASFIETLAPTPMQYEVSTMWPKTHLKWPATLAPSTQVASQVEPGLSLPAHVVPFANSEAGWASVPLQWIEVVVVVAVVAAGIAAVVVVVNVADVGIVAVVMVVLMVVVAVAVVLLLPVAVTVVAMIVVVDTVVVVAVVVLVVVVVVVVVVVASGRPDGQVGCSTGHLLQVKGQDFEAEQKPHHENR